MILLTSSVLAGRRMQKGTSPGRAGCEDHSEPECDFSWPSSVSMLSAPTMSRKSVQAAWGLVGATLCGGGVTLERGVVEEGGRGVGVREPK